MSFAFLSLPIVLLGAALLALGLWLAQRLRVQHREVEVNSTLFWQAAMDEKRVRVFVRRFRHWPAWALLVAIASLIWLLLAGPTTRSLSGTQHIVLLDRSEQDGEARAEDLELAIQQASLLPTGSREIVSIGNHFQTLVSQGEPAELASMRLNEQADPSPRALAAAVETLAFRATDQHPVEFHIVGDTELEQSLVDSLPSNVSIFRVAREDAQKQAEISTLGVANASSGLWDRIDIAIGFAAEGSVDAKSLSAQIDDQSVDLEFINQGQNEFLIADMPAEGGTLSVLLAGRKLGSLTIPKRDLIRVKLEPNVPDTLRELVALDRACEIVEGAADVTIGSSESADFGLSDGDQPAFWIQSETADAELALDELVDQLALKQIDATGIAEQSGKLIDVQVQAGDARRITVWRSLFSTAFDFQESRACPIFVARSIRWIANRPSLVPWAEQGERLPIDSPNYDRATGTLALTSDGREIQTVRLASTVVSAASIPESPSAGFLNWFSLTTWIGLILVVLISVEWTLYQRGRMP